MEAVQVVHQEHHMEAVHRAVLYLGQVDMVFGLKNCKGREVAGVVQVGDKENYLNTKKLQLKYNFHSIFLFK